MNYEEFRQDVSQIPDSVKFLINGKNEELQEIGKEINKYNPNIVVFVGHGSSESVGTYLASLIMKYLNILTIQCNISAILDDLVSYENLRALVISISKSGETKDVVMATEILKKCSNMTLSITNDGQSSLANLSDININFSGTSEICSAFSKSVILSMVASVMLVAHWKRDAKWLSLAKKSLEGIAKSPESFNVPDLSNIQSTDPVLVVAEGMGIACAEELSLKLMEMYRIHAKVSTASAFWHAAACSIKQGDALVCISLGDKNSELVDKVVTSVEVLEPTIYHVYINSDAKRSLVCGPSCAIHASYSIYKSLHEFEPWNPYSYRIF